MATTSDHIKATRDQDLKARLIAAAEMAGIDAPSFWVESNLGRLVSTNVQDGQTIADVYTYAAATYTPTPRPGENLAAVTDDHLTAAIAAVQAATP